MVVAERVTPNLAVDLAPNHSVGLNLKNPVMIAAGTFGSDGYGLGIGDEIDLNLLGAVIPKTVTRHFKDGNKHPRKFPEPFQRPSPIDPSDYLNSYGLNNPGIKNILQKQVPKWWNSGATYVLSMSADDKYEFEEMAEMTRGVRGFSAIELNLSCPNVKERRLFSHDATDTKDVVSAVTKHAEVPVLVKLAPNVPNIGDIASAAEEGGAAALTVCNTVPAMDIDLKTWRPVLGHVTGGLSGPAIRTVAMALVYRASKEVNIPIVGVGGITSPGDALKFLLAGATAVQVGTASLIDIKTPFKIVEGISSYLCENNIPAVSDLIGAIDDLPVNE